MDNALQQFIEFLKNDIKEWEEAADFYEQYVFSVTDHGDESLTRSGKEEANKYRARVAERKLLLEKLRE